MNNIKISFSGIDFFPDTNFTDDTYINYRKVPINDYLGSSTSIEWKGNTETVQSIFYDAFKLTFIVREDKKNGFSKIAYAPTIQVFEYDSLNVLQNTINAKFISVDFEQVTENREFYICTFSFADIATKKIQNNFGKSENNYLSIITNIATTYASFPNKFENIQPFEFSQNVKNSFKDNIVDYNKLTKFHRVLVFVDENTSNSLSDFYTGISLVGKTSSNYTLKYYLNGVLQVTSTEFEIISDELIGDNLHKIEVKLIESNTINTPYN